MLDGAVALGLAVVRAARTGSIITPSLVLSFLRNVSFVGVTGIVHFDRQGRRDFPVYDFVNQVNGSTELLVAQWRTSVSASAVVDFPVTPVWPGGQRPNHTTPADSVCTASASSSPRGNCPKCDRTVIIPIVVGVLAFLAVVVLMLFWGRRQVSATLFEQTARAEMSARNAIHEAEVKSSFLANMSHEIRTPLHAILSMGRMLLDSRCSDPSASEQDINDLCQIVKASETLEALVNDILFISKMQTVGFKLDSRENDVCELVEDIAQVLSMRSASKAVECVVLLRLPEFTYDVRRIGMGKKKKKRGRREGERERECVCAEEPGFCSFRNVAFINVSVPLFLFG